MNAYQDTTAITTAPLVAARDSRSLLFVLAGSGLVVAKLLYILVELYYNNTLQLFGSTPGIDVDDIERFHVFGRHVAALGATLLVTGMFIRRMAKRVRAGRTRPRLLLLATVALAVYSITLMLQTAIMHTLIERSSNRTAYRAYAGGIAQTLITSGVGDSFGLDSTVKEHDMTVRDSNTMLALMPLASTQTDSFADRLADNHHAIAAALRAYLFHTRFRDDMRHFVAARHELASIWDAMNDASRKINRSFVEASDAILEPRQQGFRDLVGKYQAYRSAQQRYQRYAQRASASRRAAAYDRFVDQAGLPPTLSATKFFNHPKVRRESGLYSEDGDHAPMSIIEDGTRLAAERDHMIKEAEQKLADNMPTKLVPFIDLNMRFEEFLALPPIQARIASRFDNERYVDLSLTPSEFFRKTWSQEAAREVEDIVDRYVLEDSSDLSAPDMQDIRSHALKAAYIMPLALCLSTVFLLLNILSLLPWRRLERRGRLVLGAVIVFTIARAAFTPLDGNGTLDPAFDLPVGVKQIARTARVINPFGSVLTQIAPPTSLGLLPDSICNERRSIYRNGDRNFFNCF